MPTLQLAENTIRMNVTSHMVNVLLIIAKPLDCKFSNNEKQEVLT